MARLRYDGICNWKLYYITKKYKLYFEKKLVYFA